MNFTSVISATLLSLLLMTTVGCAGSATSESTGEYIDDTAITTRVKAALVKDPVAKAREVNVETFKGVVQLSGFVSSQEAMDQAVTVARNIKGVKSVQNNMSIR
jgi:hyperosmotically inducible protein